MLYEKFPRPEGALYLEDMVVGLHYYEVNGTVYGGDFDPRYERIVCSSPVRFELHSSYEDIHESQKDLFVFDSIYAVDPYNDRFWSKKSFASDDNLYHDRSHNDNYLFSDPAAAEAYALWVKQYWLDHPELKREILEDHDSWNIMDDYYDYDYNYNEHPNYMGEDFDSHDNF